MAWVKLDDQAPRHAKMLKAGPAACWLWVCGIAHSQSQLSDGFVSRDALPMIGVKGVARCIKLADELVKIGLFDRADGGYMVHGYLDHNPSRARVLEKRAEDAERKRRAEESGRNPKGIPPDSGAPRAGVPSHPIREVQERARVELDESTAVLDRARAFIERYPQIYAHERHGARYPVKEARDFPTFVTLVQTWTDDQRLDDMFRVFLHLKGRDVLNQPGSPGQFLHHAPECDQLLRAEGR